MDISDISSTTANRSIRLHPILTISADLERLPAKDEEAQIRANEDANDDVAVVVHGE